MKSLFLLLLIILKRNINITVPKGGDKKKLLELSEKNVNYFKEELKKKKICILEGKTDDAKQKVLYAITKRSSTCRNCLFILNVLTILISREVILFCNGLF